MSAKDRPFARFAAEMCYGKTGLANLDASRCPVCGGEAKNFRDEISRKEFSISGMCQKCQDLTFKGGDN
jgi:hypothetical protein